MPKQFRLKKRFGKRAAIEDDEKVRRPRAMRVCRIAQPTPFRCRLARHHDGRG